jgi:hypothetical protein
LKARAHCVQPNCPFPLGGSPFPLGESPCPLGGGAAAARGRVAGWLP